MTHNPEEADYGCGCTETWVDTTCLGCSRATIHQDEETIYTKHIALVEAVNAARDDWQHQLAERELHGFRTAARILGYAVELIIEADLHYLNQGVDRPMCGGVFLDWKSS